MLDEERRQRALDALNVLDTPPDERVDRITRLAQDFFDVPMVSVTLLDRDRQWRKSQIGLPGQEGPREGTFCDATIRQTGTLVIEDAEKDAVFASNPFVQGEPHLRFYAGHPLQAPGGEQVGTLCLLDIKPRTLDALQRNLLRDLALWVQTELTERQELDHAAIVQQAFTPKGLPQPAGFSVAAGSAPAGTISGDLHDITLRGEQLRITLADVMGKGIGAGIIAAAVRASMRTAPNRSVLEAVSEVDSLLEADIGNLHMFVTMFCADLNTTTGEIQYVDGGHSLSFIHRADNSWEHLPSTGLPLGMGMDERHDVVSVRLGPGDALLSCSDGLLDLLDLDDPFSQVDEIVREYGVEGSVREAVRRAVHLKAPDDVTVLLIKRDP